MPESMEERITRLLLEHAQNVPEARPFPVGLSIRKDLAVESLSLVSVAVKLGDELGVDVLEAGVELGTLETVGDLVTIGRSLASHAAAELA
jgi:acyl carrier protein